MANAELLHRDITERIIKSFFEVCSEIGPGHFESVYKNCMVIAMQDNGLKCATEVQYAVYFRGRNVGEYRADIVVENSVIVEVKVGPKIHEAHQRQTLNYLKTSKLQVGLILKFGHKTEFDRIFYGGA